MVYFVPRETFLNDIVSAVQIGENSRACMNNKSGDTIADIMLDMFTVQNIETEAQSAPELKELAAIHAEMRQINHSAAEVLLGVVNSIQAVVESIDNIAAVSSEQLSAEATCLKEMVDHFTLASE